MPVPTQLFERYTLPELRKIRKGFDREYDEACASVPDSKSTTWLLERMHLLDRLIERKETESSLPDVPTGRRKKKV